MNTDKSTTVPQPLNVQRFAWNLWNNAARRDAILDKMTEKQARTAERWLHGQRGLRILDAGCGSGWLCQRLQHFGKTTGVDLADEAIATAKRRMPHSLFIAGDFMEVTLPHAHFDVITCFELLAHVADQRALVGKMFALLKPDGLLLISTQNRPVLENCSWVGPAAPGMLRHWLDIRELQQLLRPYFDIEVITSVHPVGNRGWRRLINNRFVARPLDAVTFGGYTRFREYALQGWSLMLMCRRREQPL